MNEMTKATLCSLVGASVFTAVKAFSPEVQEEPIRDIFRGVGAGYGLATSAYFVHGMLKPVYLGHVQERWAEASQMLIEVPKATMVNLIVTGAIIGTTYIPKF